MSSSTITASSLEIEKALVSACVLEPSAFAEVSADPADFVSPIYRKTWEAMQELSARGEVWDATVMLDMVPKFSAGALDMMAPASLAPQYALRLAENASKRRLRLALAEALQKENADLSATQWLSEAYQLLQNVGTKHADSTHSVGDAVKERYAQYQEILDARAKGDPAATGVPTGIEKLDEVLGGLQRGIVTLIAARPAMGKSTLSLTLTRNASAEGIGAHVFSLEEPRDAYADRVVCAESGAASTQDLRAVSLNRGQLDAVARAGDRMLRRKHWLIDDSCGITSDDVVCRVRRHREENQTQLVIVDYISLLRGPKGLNKRETIDYNINRLADAAKQDRMAYVVLAQLNRECERRDDKRPLLSDLKESGTLEERSKAVLMLYRDAVYNEFSDPSELEIWVRKNSQGRTGPVKAHWEPERMTIR